MRAWILCAAGLVGAMCWAGPAAAVPEAPAQWWRSPGIWAPDDAAWRAQHLADQEDANAFAADLAKSLKSGKGMGYLDQGGASPSWYQAPEQVQPFPQGYSAKLYDLAWAAFLQSHRLQEAYRLAWTAVQQRPEDRRWRQRLIQVGTWVGQREEVLRQWHWLALHGQAGARRQAVSLAASLSRPDIVIQLLSPLARADQLNDAEWKTLIYAYGELSAPDKAVADIDAALKKGGPQRYLLEQKAYLTYQMGEIAHSLAALEGVTTHFAPSPAIAIETARLLSMQGHYAEAFAALVQVVKQADRADVSFWRLYAVLAWDNHDQAAALQGEQTLYLLGAANEYDLERLIVLVGPQTPAAALAVALRGWERFHLPLFYFEALYYGGIAEQWQTVATLLQSVPAADPQGLKGYTAYWMALGQWANARHDYALAGQAYVHVLHLNPDDTVARNNLLWMLLDAGATRPLRALLIGDVLHPPADLRDVLINALDRLGMTHQALFVLMTGPTKAATPAQRLSAAGLWQDAGHEGVAWSLRRQAATASWQTIQHLASRDHDPGS